MLSTRLEVAVLVLMVISWTYCSGGTVRPLYIVGHMANRRQTVNWLLNKGANAIEADLTFDKTTGLPTRFYHGLPCDCFRSCLEHEDAKSLFRYMRDISTPGHAFFVKKFTGLFWVDLKLDGVMNLEQSGKKFAGILIDLFSNKGTNLKLVLEVMDPDHFPFIKGCVQELRRLKRVDVLKRIGAAGYDKKYFKRYIAANKELNLPPLWLSEGDPNCLAHFFRLTEVKEAIRIRDEGEGVSKVARWTIDTKKHMRNALSIGTDSIVTNDPDDLYEVVHEHDFRGIYRLATPQDDPFKKIQGHGPYRVGCHYRTKWYSPWAGTYQCWRDTDISGKNWCYTTRYCKQDRSSCRFSDTCKS